MGRGGQPLTPSLAAHTQLPAQAILILPLELQAQASPISSLSMSPVPWNVGQSPRGCVE